MRRNLKEVDKDARLAIKATKAKEILITMEVFTMMGSL